MPGRDYEWKNYYLSLASKKIKDEEDHNVSDGNSSECSSDESTRVVRSEDDTGTETEENDNSACTIDSAPKSLVRSNGSDADFEDRDDNASTSEGSMPKSLIRKECTGNNHFEKEQK